MFSLYQAVSLPSRAAIRLQKDVQPGVVAYDPWVFHFKFPWNEVLWGQWPCLSSSLLDPRRLAQFWHKAGTQYTRVDWMNYTKGAGRVSEWIHGILHIPFADNEFPKGGHRSAIFVFWDLGISWACKKKCCRVISEVSSVLRCEAKEGPEHKVIWDHCDLENRNPEYLFLLSREGENGGDLPSVHLAFIIIPCASRWYTLGKGRERRGHS